MGKALVAAGVAAIVVGGGTLGYGLTRPKPKVIVDAMPFAGKIDNLLAERRDALRKRTEAVAQEDHVRGGLGDQQTAHDMFERGELDLQVQPNEVLEFGQVIGGAAMRLQLIPADGTPFSHDGQPTDRVVVKGETIILQRVSAVALKITAQAPVGFVAISQTIPKTFFDGIGKELEAANSGLILSLGNQKVQLGKPLVTGAKTNRSPLQFDPAVTVETAVPIGAGNFLPFLIAGGGGAGLGLLLLMLGLVRRSSGSAAVAVAGSNTSPASTVTPVGFATTGLAIGTPNVTVGSGEYPVVAPSVLGPGAVLGRWEIVQRLGSGGMADVFKARSIGEAGFAKMVALKVMHAHLARSERAVDHFLDEARLAAQIHHPNVVQILDLGKIGGEYAIAMEFVDGVDLERLLQGAREAGRVIPLNVAVGILRRICDGVAAAHNAVSADGTPLQIVHRDIKAANVLVSRQGSVKVVDFGIAKAAIQSHFTMAGETKGTPSMMAPEQRVGEVVDKRADIYSLAAVGYELLTGAAVNLDMATIAHLGIAGWPHLPKPSELRPGVPVEFDAILLGAMAYDRNERPASCEVFEAQIEQVAQLYALAASDKDLGRWVTVETNAVPDGENTEIASRPVLPA